MKKNFYLIGLTLISFNSFAQNTEHKSDYKITGTYQVPVVDEKLKPFAKFSVLIKQEIKNDELVTKYDLPLALTGEEKEIIVTGSSEPGAPPMSGEFSTGTCSDTAHQRACTMVYNQNLKINESAAAAYLNSLNLPDEELQMRLQVAREFSGDPIGVLIIPKH
jgi:hypothetical protein